MYARAGSRGYYNTDYRASSLLSGVDYSYPLYGFRTINTIIVRSDLVSFGREFFNYKFGITKLEDYVLEWSKDGKKFNTKVYREALDRDFIGTFKLLEDFQINFLKSEAFKVQY